MKPTLSILDDQEIHKTHQAALDILRDVGVRFGSERAEEVLREAGQSVDPASRAVRLDSGLVEQCLAKLPSRVLLAAREERRDAVLGTGKVHTCLDGQGTFMIDPDSGQRRPSTLADLISATRLSDALEAVDYFWLPVVPGDVPDSVRTLVEVATAFMHTSRHVQHEVKHPQDVPYLLEMLDALLGDRRRHAQRPIYSVVCCPVSPLQHEPDMTTACMEMARHDVPICLMPMPLAGATAPVTLAGTLAVTYAEFLSGVVLYQLVRPGLPMILAVGSTILDMRTGLYSAGAPELALLNIALMQIGRHLGVPTMAQGLVSDAKAPGAQAAYEKTVNGLSAFLAGSDVVNGLGLLDSHQLLALEQLVIDDEITCLVRRVTQGFELDDEHLMLDLIREVGIGGHFLGQRRTLEHLKRGEHFKPRLSFRGSYESWREQRYDEVGAARERVRCLLAEHEGSPLAPEVEKALRAAVVRADPSAHFEIPVSCTAG